MVVVVGGGEEENPIIFHDGPLQTLNVLSFKKKPHTQTYFSFCFGCVDRNLKKIKKKKV